MPSYCQRIFNAAATTQLLQDSEGTGHTFAMHLLPSDDREGFLRRRLAAAPAPGTPAPEAVCGFLSRNDIVDVVQALLNSDRGQWMLGMMDDGGLAGHVCEKATALGLPRRISFAGITRNANRLQEEYVVEELAQVQLYARRWPPPSPNAPPFYVVTCFPTKRAPNMGIDDWGDDRIIGSSLFQQFHDVQHVQDNTNEGLRQRAEAYALWLQNNLANVARGTMGRNSPLPR